MSIGIAGVSDYGMGFNFNTSHTFRFARGLYIGPGLSVYKIKDIGGFYVPVSGELIYSGVNPISILGVVSGGYGLYNGSETDKATFSPFGRLGLGVQFKNQRSTPYLYAFVSKMQLSYKEKVFDEDWSFTEDFTLVGLQFGIFLRFHK